MKKSSGFCVGLAGILLLGTIFVEGDAQRLTRRRSTSTTTTVSPEVETLAQREANLLAREQSLNLRENKFREREQNFTLREEEIRVREQKISVREENIKIRELKGDDVPVSTTPAPDLSVVRLDSTATGRYLELGSTDSCPENMRFFAVPGSKTEGKCDCDYHQCSRPLLYSPKYNQCFWAWSPGPCEQGEWFTYNDTLHPVCTKNKCPPSVSVKSNVYFFQDPDDNECYETTTQGYCQEDGQTLLATSDDPFPKCRTHSMCFPLTVPAYQECIAGNRRHIEGFCE